MKVKNFVLGIGIVIVFALTLHVGIDAFYSFPDYDDYCNRTKIPIPVERGLDMSNNATYCLEHNGTWREGYCDLYYECEQAFEEANTDHSKLVFIISLVVGLLAVGAGVFFLRFEPVGSALFGSGIWALFYGTIINWRNFTELWRFFLLFIALVFLVWLTIRLNRKK